MDHAASQPIDMERLRARLRSPSVIDSEQRSADRWNCNWRATLCYGEVEFGCIVENIGPGGCRIQVFTHRIGVGSEIEISIPSRSRNYAGRIVWKRADEAGIAFN